MSATEAAMDRLLLRNGFAAAIRVPLPADASLRRYVRLLDGPRPALLAVYAPGQPGLAAFAQLRAHLSATGVSVPDILAADEAAGLLLAEDFGDGLLANRLDQGAAPGPLFAAAVEALLAIQSLPPPAVLPLWDAAAMLRATGASLFDWWWPAWFGAPPGPDARGEIDAALATLLAPLDAATPVFVHRDWFAGNLFWLPDRAGLARIGVIDFQDAALGHAAYDLMALVHDSRRDLPGGIAEDATRRYLAARPDLDPRAFRTACVACRAQRLLRVAAQWVRLDRRDGKPHYLTYGPRTWRLLHEALQAPEAAALKRALDRWIRADRRANPPAVPACGAAAQ